MVYCLLLILGTSTQPTVSVDLIELNHYHDANGCKVFDQLIFYEWSAEYRRFDVCDWCMIERTLAAPQKEPSGQWVYRWTDAKDRRRVIVSRLFRETWTQTDPERDQLKLFPAKNRRSIEAIR